MYRDFLTIYSDVPLRNGESINLDAGFKVFDKFEDNEPLWLGFKKNIEWTIYDTVDGALSYNSQLVIVAATLIS